MASVPAIDGKFFARNGNRFHFRGVTYGTFERSSDGSSFPSREQIKNDFVAMREAGFTVVRTYEPPTPDIVELAADWDLHILAGAFHPDWRYFLGASRRDFQRVARSARQSIRVTARALSGSEQVLGVALGNEIPADVLRWYGADRVASVIRDLVDTVRSEDPDLLITYGNYPTAEYLPLAELDFLMFNVYLEQPSDLRRYVSRLHHLAGDRPLVLGELGCDAGTTPAAEAHQAAALAAQLDVAVERGVAGTCVFAWTDEWSVGGHRVEDWHFGLTRADRSPRPALAACANANQKTVRDLDRSWPSISVIICAYNAAATLDECLRHTCALDYPNLEVVVVDDGSTDDTAAIARAHPRARLYEVPHGGLSIARNDGFRTARGELIAYLDSDAYPTPEWPYYLALGLEGHGVVGVGGPNVGPPSDSRAARVVAAAPGGPIHVLTADDEAEHIPGCNMAFRRDALIEVGGFDPVFVTAGDDVDLCWRVLDRGWKIGFHPAALVWHHRRGGLRAYLRQQRGYGRSEALVEARHPNRFSSVGSARWKGRIYQPAAGRASRQRIYRGDYGTAAYQSVYQGGGYFVDLLHQVGVPLLVVLALTAPLAFVSAWMGLPAAAAVSSLAALVLVDTCRATSSRVARTRPWLFGLRVAIHQVLQPLVRTWTRARTRHQALRTLPAHEPMPPAVRTAARGVVVFRHDGSRAGFAARLAGHLRGLGIRSMALSGWEDHDGRFVLSPLVFGDLVTSSHPVGFVQARIRPRLRTARLLLLIGLGALALVANELMAPVVLVFVSSALGHGVVRSKTLLRSAMDRSH